MLSGGQRSPGENLYDGTTACVAGALDHVAFQLAGDLEFEAGQFLAQAGQSHEQFLAINMIGDSVSIIPEGGVHIQLWIHISNWLEVWQQGGVSGHAIE
jgi:hypothetical protein